MDAIVEASVTQTQLNDDSDGRDGYGIAAAAAAAAAAGRADPLPPTYPGKPPSSGHGGGNELYKMMGKVLIKLTETQTQMADATVKSLEMADKPKITVKPFQGGTDDFGSFRAEFETAYSNPMLSDKAKFSILKSLLKGEALTTISGLQCADGALDAAWELLNEKYNNVAMVIRTLTKSAANLAAVGKEDATAKVRALYDTLATTQRRLEHLGVPDSHSTVMMWEEKFPINYRLEWNRAIQEKKADPASGKEFLKVMYRKLRTYEMLHASDAKPQEEGEQKNSSNKPWGKKGVRSDNKDFKPSSGSSHTGTDGKSVDKPDNGGGAKGSSSTPSGGNNMQKSNSTSSQKTNNGGKAAQASGAALHGQKQKQA